MPFSSSGEYEGIETASREIVRLRRQVKIYESKVVMKAKEIKMLRNMIRVLETQSLSTATDSDTVIKAGCQGPNLR